MNKAIKRSVTDLSHLMGPSSSPFQLLRSSILVQTHERDEKILLKIAYRQASDLRDDAHQFFPQEVN